MATEENKNPYTGIDIEENNPYAGIDTGRYNKREYTGPTTSSTTVVGGSYQQVREGLVDTTQFQKGFEGSFMIPEDPLVELESNLNMTGADIDDFTGGIAMSDNINLNKNFQNTLKGWSQMWRKAKGDNQRRIGSWIGLSEQGMKNFDAYKAMWDDELNDVNVSKGKYIYGVNGIQKVNGRNVTVEDMIKSNNESGQSFNINIVQDGNGNDMAVMNFVVENQNVELCLTCLNERRRNELFNLRSDINQEAQNSFNTNEGSTFSYKSNYKEDAMYEKHTIDGVKTTTINGRPITYKVTEDTKTLTEDYINNRERGGELFATGLYRNINQPNIASSMHQLWERLGNANDFKRFELNQNILERLKKENEFLVSKNPNSNRFELNANLLTKDVMAGLSNDIKLSMLRDEAKQVWLYQNNQDTYKQQENGRADNLNTITALKEALPSNYFSSANDGGQYIPDTDLAKHTTMFQRLYGIYNPDTQTRDGGMIDAHGNIKAKHMVEIINSYTNTHGMGRAYTVNDIEKHYRNKFMLPGVDSSGNEVPGLEGDELENKVKKAMNAVYANPGKIYMGKTQKDRTVIFTPSSEFGFNTDNVIEMPFGVVGGTGKSHEHVAGANVIDFFNLLDNKFRSSGRKDEHNAFLMAANSMIGVGTNRIFGTEKEPKWWTPN